MKKYILFLFLGIYCLCGSPQCPPLTPLWALGHIVWEDSLNTTFGATRIVDGYLERGIPVDAIIIDSPWTTCYNDFNWDTNRYTEPEQMLRDFAEKGVRTILWLTGNVNLQCKDTRDQKCAAYDEVVSRHYAVNNGKPTKWWKGFGLHIDFTNREATQWWYSQLDKVFSENVYGWKTDQGDFLLPKSFETSKGMMSNKEFRHYYYDAMYDYTVSRKRDGIIIARPFSHQGGLEASVEKMNMGWCGDFSGNWDGLKLQIDNIYRSSQYGYGAVGCEVGGFYNERSNAHQFARYAQFGSMTACIINGGENGPFSSHLPWYHGSDVEQAYKWCVSLMKELAPYKFSTLVDVHLHGGSLLKSISLGEYSHQLGADIFTKALVSDNDKPAFHLPDDGEWIDFWNGSHHHAGEMISRLYGISQFPLFVRSGAIIPVSAGSSMGTAEVAKEGSRIFVIYPNGRTSRLFHLPKGDGVDYFECTVSYDEKSHKVSVSADEKCDFVFIVRGNGKQGIGRMTGMDFELKVAP